MSDVSVQANRGTGRRGHRCTCRYGHGGASDGTICVLLDQRIDVDIAGVLALIPGEDRRVTAEGDISTLRVWVSKQLVS